jgi:hypothetical protein
MSRCVPLCVTSGCHVSFTFQSAICKRGLCVLSEFSLFESQDRDEEHTGICQCKSGNDVMLLQVLVQTCCVSCADWRLPSASCAN